MIEIIAFYIGIIGMIILTLAYLLLQFEYIKSESDTYNYMNLIGSSSILFSLFYEWNTGAALIEITWIIITLATIFNKKNKERKKGF